MRAAAVVDLPTGAGWTFEPKWDGWRGLAFHQGDTVYLQSRSAKPLAQYFPDITRAVRAALPPGTVLDGELVVWDRQRTSFARLQRRVNAGTQLLRMVREFPAHLVVFDLLAVDGVALLDRPLAERRARLMELLEGAPPQLALCPQTTDTPVVQDWLANWTAAGVEGVVAKRVDSTYVPGSRGWRKLRARSTTEAVIGGVTGGITTPESLLLGRFDALGRLRYVGRTHPLNAVFRREVGGLLAPAAARRGGGIAHPWPKPLPAAWSGQLVRAEPLPYTQVRPVLVVEIDVDSAFEHNRWRHGVRYVRVRLDLSTEDVPLLD